MRRFDRTIIVVIVALVVVIGITALIALRQGERAPRVAYLAPSVGPFNVYITAQDSTPQQLTFSQTGVYDFAVSPDGRYIAYSEDQPDGQTRDLMLLDLANNTIRALTNCRTENAVCTAPAWRPDGSALAYQRGELNDPMGAVSRIWLLDLSDNSTFPLFEQAEVLGAEPIWSPDGNRLAFYDNNTQAVLIYNFNAQDETTQLQALPAGNGSSGAFAPDSAHLLFPELLIAEPTRSVMRLANLETGNLRSLTSEDELTEDRFAAWHPDGRRVVVTRKYLDERYTQGDQVYLVEIDTGVAQPLIFDENYQHSAPSWSADGEQLVLHRYSFETGFPEIWVYNLETKALTRLVEDGFFPRWAGT
jgi:TolB protein